MDGSGQVYGIPASLLRSIPELSGAKIHVLRLGHLPRLARVAPHLLDEGEVPIEEIARAVPILASNGLEYPATFPPALDVESARAALAKIRAAAAEAFAADIPAGDGEAENRGPGNGLGWWLDLYHFAMTVLHLSRNDALEMPLGELFALRTAQAACCGLTFKAPTYAERDLLDALDKAESMEEP